MCDGPVFLQSKPEIEAAIRAALGSDYEVHYFYCEKFDSMELKVTRDGFEYGELCDNPLERVPYIVRAFKKAGVVS